jgi:hypothetical protein
VWRELPRHFGFELAAGEIEVMKAAAALDAKDRQRRFEPDSVRRQAEASEAIRLAAAQWAAPQYGRLEQLRGQGLA